MLDYMKSRVSGGDICRKIQVPCTNSRVSGGDIEFIPTATMRIPQSKLKRS